MTGRMMLCRIILAPVYLQYEFTVRVSICSYPMLLTDSILYSTRTKLVAFPAWHVTFLFLFLLHPLPVIKPARSVVPYIGCK